MADETLSVDSDGIILVTAGSSTEGSSVDLDDSSADMAWKVADRVQTILMEARRQIVPDCPRHPNTHPLRASALNDRPVWVCPADQVAIAEIGKLQQT